MKKVVCQSTADGVTRVFGRKLGAALSSGGTILLKGELGSGKTTFVQGLAEGLGVQTSLTSPTFTIMNVYPTRHPAIQALAHIDLYRLTTHDRLDEIDLPTLQHDPHTLVVVEWPERATTQWQYVLGQIQFNLGATMNQRQLTITGELASLFE